jgi:hypothetical protein
MPHEWLLAYLLAILTPGASDGIAPRLPLSHLLVSFFNPSAGAEGHVMVAAFPW